MDEKPITVKLSEAQRNLLLEHQKEFADPELARLCSIAFKKDNTYKIHLTEEQLEDLCGEFFAIANHNENRKVQDKLDELADYLENYMPDFSDDGDEED